MTGGKTAGAHLKGSAASVELHIGALVAKGRRLAPSRDHAAAAQQLSPPGGPLVQVANFKLSSPSDAVAKALTDAAPGGALDHLIADAWSQLDQGWPQSRPPPPNDDGRPRLTRLSSPAQVEARIRDALRRNKRRLSAQDRAATAALAELLGRPGAALYASRIVQVSLGYTPTVLAALSPASNALDVVIVLSPLPGREAQC